MSIYCDLIRLEEFNNITWRFILKLVIILTWGGLMCRFKTVTTNIPLPILAITSVNLVSSCFLVILLNALHKNSLPWGNSYGFTSNRGPVMIISVLFFVLEIQTQVLGGLESAIHSKKTSSSGFTMNTPSVFRPWSEFTAKL